MKTPEQKKAQAEHARKWQTLSQSERDQVKKQNIETQAKAAGETPWHFEYVLNKSGSGWSLCGKLKI
jgi:hypothetical protein